LAVNENVQLTIDINLSCQSSNKNGIFNRISYKILNKLISQQTFIDILAFTCVKHKNQLNVKISEGFISMAKADVENH